MVEYLSTCLICRILSSMNHVIAIIIVKDCDHNAIAMYEAKSISIEATMRPLCLYHGQSPRCLAVCELSQDNCCDDSIRPNGHVDI